ncbi:MAG: hypothetical protein MZV63_10045 [Marinilabiliales bacterium]|nr:hypothetical protein [Marinilabiliales bacterium]
MGWNPVCRAPAYFDGDVLRGVTFDIQRGIYKTYTGLTSDAQFGSNAAPVNATSNRLLGNKGDKYNNVLITGNHGMFSGRTEENNAMTGAFIRKYIDVSRPTSLVNVNKSNPVLDCVPIR